MFARRFIRERGQSVIPNRRLRARFVAIRMALELHCALEMATGIHGYAFEAAIQIATDMDILTSEEER